MLTGTCKRAEVSLLTRNSKYVESSWEDYHFARVIFFKFLLLTNQETPQEKREVLAVSSAVGL